MNTYKFKEILKWLFTPVSTEYSFRTFTGYAMYF